MSSYTKMLKPQKNGLGYRKLENLMESQRVSPFDIAKNGLKGTESESPQKRLQEGYLELNDNFRERRARCEKVRPDE